MRKAPVEALENDVRLLRLPCCLLDLDDGLLVSERTAFTRGFGLVDWCVRGGVGCASAGGLVLPRA